jgi:hypothetical protein
MPGYPKVFSRHHEGGFPDNIADQGNAVCFPALDQMLALSVEVRVTGIKLGHRVAIYCPSADGQGNRLSGVAQTVIDETHNLLCKLNGGSTELKARGAWQNGEGQTIIEDVVIVYSHCSELTDGLLTSIANHAQWIKAAAHQRSVGIEIDHEMHLI